MNTALKRISVLAALLMCYSRPFAKIGIGSIYITEVVVLLLVPFALLSNKTNKRNYLEHTILFMIIYHFVGVLVFDFGRYQLSEIIRDSIIWLYPVTAIFVARIENIDIDHLVKIFHKVITVFLFVFPILFYLQNIGGPGTVGNIPIKKSDTTTALSLYILISFHNRKIKTLHLILLILNIFLVSSQGRSSLMILFITLVGSLYLNKEVLKFVKISKRKIAFFVVLVGLISVIQTPTLRSHGRAVGVGQIITNAISIFGDSGSRSSDVEKTELFRTFWWLDIIIDSMSVDRLFYAHGYGLNLADYYGYQANPEHLLRSPHNFIFTLLARSGWIISISFSLLIGFIMLNGLKLPGFYPSCSFIIAMMLLNGLFDVYLEGPMGAFPFWLFCGFILSKMNDKKRELSIGTSD